MIELESPQPPSKSQLKRDHKALQMLAKRLCHLPQTELAQWALSDATRAALDETARLKDQRVLGRQYKWIANCLLREDAATVQALLNHY
ncbi:DUF615 domain-containing protein [Rhodopseudomonas palustris]|uniref:DUF615 domain-containing protein n=1 Tax=Thiospirillum jenense TaxID=1653858 RepID=A0A839HBU7_9GAMM|nr:DUF615 domain-containing protein [Thiospirillum jenense]MBB1089668.1 DUF615 domain-containing protein [Rhodopseudomonas palustris]MBB1124768.1 DUF615 domain-containing protein [Thiospirillum jenense]